jgi:hypothetical protein
MNDNFQVYRKEYYSFIYVKLQYLDFNRFFMPLLYR